MKRQKVIELDCVEKNLSIDWEAVLGDDDVPELEIIANTPPPPEPSLSGEYSSVCVRSLTDNEIDQQLKHQRSLLAKFGDKLHDKGAKIRSRIGNLEYEKQRRMFTFRPEKTDEDGFQILSHSKSAGSLDVPRKASTASKDSTLKWNTGSKDVTRSMFSGSLDVPRKASTASKDSTFKWNTGSKDVTRSMFSGSSDVSRQASTASKDSTFKWNTGSKDVTRSMFSGYKDPKGGRKPNEDSVKKKRKDSSPYLLVDEDEDDDDSFIGYETPRKWSLKASPSQSSSLKKKSDDKVINLDEDEPQSPVVVEDALELPEGLPEEICYPSSDDPDTVEVHLKDLKCLSPREYLTSPVINFYIRFLQHQVFSANQTAANSHFFNTFFYKKLIEAVSYKGNDKDAFFVKFRRWWKGFHLFSKSYIFIPIHEDVHWSLVIICIPEKEDESGLTIIHLDSLGLHPRRLIFNNVKRFLIEEWNYLNQDDLLWDLPISEKIWRDLPNRINEAVVQVPQQKNDYDCGLFMLFFIKRFIEEAPQRLKLKDLEMIHKKWFKPDEASALRNIIWNKLIDLFRESNQTD